MVKLWRDERGIAMTEGVIVMPFFILIMMSLIALHHLYDGRLEAQVSSAARAFQYAREGCEGNMGTVTDNSDYAADLTEDQRGILESGAGENPVNGAHADGEELVAVGDVPALFGGPTVLVRGKQDVACTMPPTDSVFGGIADEVRDMVNW